MLDKEKAAEHGVDRVPAIIVSAAVAIDRIRYYGAPLGNELPTLGRRDTHDGHGSDHADRDRAARG